MGILNITPDSFFDGGRYHAHPLAVARALEMVAEGADIIDIGGEKAGPGEPVSAEEELGRVIPVIEAVRREVSTPISVDTFKPEVARAAMEAGADIINSIDGFQDPEMRRVASATGAAVVVMHIKGRPRVANPNPVYRDVVEEVAGFLERQARQCVEDGIERDRIIIDPGPGFGKTTYQDLAVIRGLDRLTVLPYPLLLAVSRKKFIGELLDLDVDQRLEGSLAVAAWGVLKGARIIRAHDVRATRRVILMTEAVMNPEVVETHG
jgi:dihydropteroate synthase